MTAEFNTGSGITQFNPVPEETEKNSVRTFWQKIADRMPPRLIILISDFHSNKKVFFPVSIALGGVLLIVVFGLFFGKYNSSSILQPTTPPTPVLTSTPLPTQQGDFITVTKNGLKDLNGQISSVDVEQKRLQPSKLEFDLGF